jgi:dihydroorotase-like cyclic amidohydrolase
VFDYEKTFVVKDEDQKSKCRWTPYAGETLRGEIKAVYIDGNQII